MLTEKHERENMKIEILLSTYNGERYLDELLNSLLNQTHRDFHITIRDDGSQDGTRDIIDRYCCEAPERFTLLAGERNLGYPDCFWYLLEHADKADMYAFCDQDDVWDEEKLACCCEKCESADPNRPLLYVHDYYISNGNLNVNGEYHILEQGYRADYSYNLIYYVMASGFTMVLNEALRRRVLQGKLYGEGLPHDRWIFWCGFFVGEIVTDSRLLATYRRHDHTATITGKGNWILLKEWWENDIRGTRMRLWETYGNKFVDQYHIEMESRMPGVASDWRMLLKSRRGAAAYLRRLFFPKRLKPSLAGELVLRLSFLLNK